MELTLQARAMAMFSIQALTSERFCQLLVVVMSHVFELHVADGFVASYNASLFTNLGVDHGVRTGFAVYFRL